jgi:hypothetical protein
MSLSRGEAIRSARVAVIATTASYQASFEKWFGQKIEPPRVGFPVEYS